MRTAAATLICWSSLLLSASLALAEEIVPHRANYSLSRLSSQPNSGIVDVRGHMQIRVQASCDGWGVEQFFGFTLFTETGSFEHLAHLSGFETSTGDEYWFNTRTYDDRKLSDEVSGVARLGGGQSNAKYAKPEPAREPLPDDTVFPTGHIIHLVKAARAGIKNSRRFVFDGTDTDNPYEVSAFIGAEQLAENTALGEVSTPRYWPVRMAYYQVAAKEPAPDFEISVDLFENGIAGDMVFDYGEFSLSVALDEVEVLPEPSCQ